MILKAFYPKSRSRLIFGPGTILMLVALCFILVQQIMAPPKPVIVEHRVVESGSKSVFRKPTVTDLLHWFSELRLTPDQIKQLKTLEKAEQTDLKPVEQDIENIQREFDRLLADRQAEGVAMSEIQRISEPASKLGYIKRKITEAASDRGFAILKSQQRAEAMKIKQHQLSLTGGQK